MKCVIRIDGEEIERDVDENSYLEVKIGEQQVISLDCFYLNAENEDPNRNAPTVPHVNVGHHPDGENWEVILYVPILIPDLQALSENLSRPSQTS